MPRSSNPFFYVLLTFLFGGLLFLLFRPFVFPIAMAAIATILVVALIYMIKWSRMRYRRFKMRNTIEGIIEEKELLVTQRIDQTKNEISVIDKAMNELNLNPDNPDIQHEVIQLRADYKIEKELLLRKLAFLQIAKDRYQRIISDRQMIKDLNDKRQILDKVKGEESTAPVEDDRLVLDKDIIEQLDYMSSKMDLVEDVELAEEIIMDARQL